MAGAAEAPDSSSLLPDRVGLAPSLADDARGEHEQVEATAKHPFWAEGRGWVGAGELAAGQRVLRADGRWLRVERVEARAGLRTVYNLEVEGWHTYVVGKLGAWVHNDCVKIVSRIKDSSSLVREAKQAGKSVQKSLDKLVRELARGNKNPGLGNKPIGSGISEARARDGARVYFRETRDGTIEILGKSDKGNQQTVIDEILRVFGEGGLPCHLERFAFESSARLMLSGIASTTTLMSRSCSRTAGGSLRHFLL